jgi:hypothetical protein
LYTTLIQITADRSEFYRNHRKKIDLTPEKDSNLFLFLFQIFICGFIYFSSRYVSFNVCGRMITARPVRGSFAAGLTPNCMGQKHTSEKFVP